MAAAVAGMAFIPYYNHIMKILESDPELKKTAKGLYYRCCPSNCQGFFDVFSYFRILLDISREESDYSIRLSNPCITLIFYVSKPCTGASEFSMRGYTGKAI